MSILTLFLLLCYNEISHHHSPRDGGHARVAELADALASGASLSNQVQVQPLSRAPHTTTIFCIEVANTFEPSDPDSVHPPSAYFR